MKQTKPCKYCKKPGNFNSSIRKVLCTKHASAQQDSRNLWKTIAYLQTEIMPRDR